MAESGSWVCFAVRRTQVSEASSMRRLQDQHLQEMGDGDTTPRSPEPPLSLTRGGYKALKDPELFLQREGGWK